jgi:hypothetical protein
MVPAQSSYGDPPPPGASTSTSQTVNQGAASNKIIGAPVLSTSGQNLGTLNNMIVNYTAGRVDFGVLSLNQNAGQLIPVPWSTLRASTGTQPLSFIFAGDPAKLQNAPSFSQNSWPDVNQPSWRQSIYSYYGVNPTVVYGGGESPEGVMIGSVNYPGTTTTYKPANVMQEQRPVGPTNYQYYPYYYQYQYQYTGQP